MHALLTSLLLTSSVAFVNGAAAADPPSQPGIDAPELAHLGSHRVGVRTLILVDRENPDGRSLGTAGGAPAAPDRHLKG